MKTEAIDSGELECWTPQEVHDAHEAGEIVVIDVRTAPEYMFEHIAGALLFPMAGFEARKLPGQQGKRILFHCGSGVRSRMVAQQAHAAGIGPVAHLEGGFGAWKAAGLPYAAINPASGAPQVTRKDG